MQMLPVQDRVRRFEPENVFDPRLYDGVRRPFDIAETLPAWCYTSPTFYRREIERIFMKYWNCIGHESLVPKAGSYIAIDFLEMPLVVVRGEDMKVRAFINSCSHRGSKLLEGSGECNFIKCPYHAWAFSHTGELVGTPLFEESDAFKKSDHPLTPVKLEMWAGFMWINFDPYGESLMEQLGDLPERTAPWKAEEMVHVFGRTYEVKANWKLFTENYSDGYHVPFVHSPSIAKKKVSKRDFHDPAIHRGGYLMHYTYFEGTRGVLGGGKKAPELDLPAELKQGTFFPHVQPNAMMAFAIDSAGATVIVPTGPESCVLHRNTLFPKSTVELPDFEEILAGYIALGDQVAREDIIASEWQQMGLRSPLHKPGRFTPQDKLVHDYDLWILDQVIGNS